MNDQLAIFLLATVLMHLFIAVRLSNEYVPMIGRAYQFFSSDMFIEDGDPLYQVYPEADTMSADGLRRALSNELKDIELMCGEVSEVYMHVTDHNYSNPLTRADVIIDYSDGKIQEAIDYAVKDITGEDGE